MVLDDSFSAEGDRMQPVYVPDIQTQTNANAHNISVETTRATTAERAEANTRQNQINNEASTRQNQINAVNVRCDSLNARAANIENLVATKASISDLSAANARIDNLSASKANISDLNATNANVNNLSARAANIENLVATKASISDLNARLAGGYSASFTSVTCQQLRLGGTNYSGSVRVVTTYHAYDCIGNQVY